jgi:hypothetical protein
VNQAENRKEAALGSDEQHVKGEAAAD